VRDRPTEAPAYRCSAGTSAYRGSTKAAANSSAPTEAAALSKSSVRDQGRQEQGSSSNKPKLFHCLRILSRADIERDMNGSSSIKDCPAVKPPGTAKLAVTLSLVWLAWII